MFGGAHNRAARLGAPLADKGWETVALVTDQRGNGADRLEKAGLTVIREPLHRARAPRRVKDNANLLRRYRAEVAAIRRVIRTINADVVVNVGIENLHAAIAGRLEGRAVVWQINHTGLSMGFRRALMPVVTRLADVVMTTGTTLGEQHPGTTALGDRWVPFFSPVDVELFTPTHQVRLAARRELGLDPHELVIGTVGNLVPHKGHMTFVRAAGSLANRVRPAKFVILGARDDEHSTLHKRLWGEASNLGLAVGNDMIVVDAGPRVHELAQAFDLFWLTSEPLSEGVPTSVMEAMALGLPVVATDVGGVRDVVTPATGRLVPPLDPVALVDATLPLVADGESREQLGAAAREIALDRFSIDRCVETHLTAFERALENSVQRGRSQPHARVPGHPAPSGSEVDGDEI